jgi:hypothetical protein
MDISSLTADAALSSSVNPNLSQHTSALRVAALQQLLANSQRNAC